MVSLTIMGTERVKDSYMLRTPDSAISPPIPVNQVSENLSKLLGPIDGLERILQIVDGKLCTLEGREPIDYKGHPGFRAEIFVEGDSLKELAEKSLPYIQKVFTMAHQLHPQANAYEIQIPYIEVRDLAEVRANEVKQKEIMGDRPIKNDKKDPTLCQRLIIVGNLYDITF
jgi:hypothetical protein